MHRFHIHILHFRIPFFRIFYSTTFTLFTLLLTGLLLITPGDHILQSFHHDQLYHIIIVGAVWVLTFFIALFVYAGRLFRTRSALANIPREWNLNGHGRGSPGVGLGMGVKVGRVVREGLERSAIVSFESRPRDLRGQEQVPQYIHPVGKRRQDRGGRRGNGKEKQEEGVSQEQRQESLTTSNNAEAVPVWGIIAHPGWASPESPDLPNLHFEPVIAELGHLIEAKAVSLAPVDPLWQGNFAREGIDAEGETSPDPLVLWLLQRPGAMGLREYIGQLTSLGMIMTVDLCTEFIALYERARFSGAPLKETEFRHLMAMFAEILRNMVPLPQATVDELHAAEAAAEVCSAADDEFDEADARSMDSEGTTRRTPRPQQYSSQSSLGSQSSSAHVTAPARPATTRNVSLRTGASRYTTAPLDHRQRRDDSSRTSLAKSSTRSLRKMSSRGSVGTRSMLSSAGSVIRLADARSSLDLPYAYIGSSEERL